MKGNKARGAGVEHKGDTVAILNIGRVNRNAQQKTERIDKDVPLAAGDLLARIVTLRVSGASFFVRPGAGFFAPTRSIAKPARAGGVKVGRRANLAAHSGLAGHTLTASSTTARLVRSG